MACNSCRKKTINPSDVDQIFFEVIHQGTPGCTRTLAEIQQLKARLTCVKGKIQYRLYNRYMGFLISMINFKNYCKYNIEPMSEMLDSYGC